MSLDSLPGTGLWDCHRRDCSACALLTFGAKYICIRQGGRFVQYFVGYLAASLSSVLWMTLVHAHTHISIPQFITSRNFSMYHQTSPWFKTSTLEVLFLKISSLHLSILISTVSLTGKKGTRKARNPY